MKFYLEKVGEKSYNQYTHWCSWEKLKRKAWEKIENT